MNSELIVRILLVGFSYIMFFNAVSTPGQPHVQAALLLSGCALVGSAFETKKGV